MSRRPVSNWLAARYFRIVTGRHVQACKVTPLDTVASERDQNRNVALVNSCRPRPCQGSVIGEQLAQSPSRLALCEKERCSPLSLAFLQRYLYLLWLITVGNELQKWNPMSLQLPRGVVEFTLVAGRRKLLDLVHAQPTVNAEPAWDMYVKERQGVPLVRGGTSSSS